MKAIETEFDGIKFRSRLEARWALFLKELGVEYFYEQEAFALSCGNYLPDFWLPSLHTFLEIKPFTPTVEEQRKCQWLAAESGRRVHLVPYEPGGWNRHEGPESHTFIPFSGEADCVYGYTFSICPVCWGVDLAWGGIRDRICGDDCSGLQARVRGRPSTDEAARRANTHRFWNPSEAA